MATERPATDTIARWRLDSLIRSAGPFKDAAEIAVIAVPVLILMVAFEAWEARTAQTPITVAWCSSLLLVFALPPLLVRRHLVRQQKVLDRIRALFATGSEALTVGAQDAAESALRSIRRREVQWKFGASRWYRYAYGAMVILVTTMTGLASFVLSHNIDPRTGRRIAPSLLEMATSFLSQGWVLVVPFILCLVWGLMATDHLKALRDQRWAEFYGDRLETALRAGRSVGAFVPHVDLGSITARELFGLTSSFTKAELRRAWLRVVRELHPDHWMTASADVRRAKEAALKRVNAARDELEPFAT